jgi:hypothetical protein
MEIGKILFTGVVLDSADPYRLGRLRVQPENQTKSDILNSVDPKYLSSTKDNISPIYLWTKYDPFVFLPLLPFSLNVTPRINESVNILYPVVQNVGNTQLTRFTDAARYYLPTSPSSPMAVVYENYISSKTNTSKGDNIAPTLPLAGNGGEVPKDSRGIFPEPEDNAILGRGTTDIVLKENDVLIRAGKTKKYDINTLPTANDNRSFLQLSHFTTSMVKDMPTSQLSITTVAQQIKLLVEWHITNPENDQDVFTGYVNLYNVQRKKDERLNTKNFKVSTDIEDIKGAQLPISTNFQGQSYENAVNLINSFIFQLFSGEINMKDFDGYNGKIFKPQNDGDQFTFAFRPSPATYNKLNDLGGQSGLESVLESSNIMRFYQRIKVGNGTLAAGFGIVSGKNKDGEPIFGEPIKVKTNKYTPFKVNNESVTYGVLGAQKIYLISQDSQVGQRKVDLKNTIYGIPQPKLVDMVNQTEPMVRGDKLMDMITLIVKFLTAHVHPFHGLAPVPTALDGTLSADILQKMLDAPNTILNQNVRIN